MARGELNARQSPLDLGVLRRFFGEEASGEAAYRKLLEIVGHHRIQASPGYREAAQRLCELARRDGLDAEILSYEADENAFYLGNPVPEEWECTGAELWLLEGGEGRAQKRRLAWWEEAELSVIQRSAPTPPGGVETELVLVPEPEKEESYEGIDLKGKIILVGGEDLSRVRELAVERRGAVGIVTDRMTVLEPVRPAGDLPDSLQYTSFWWSGDEKRCFGFVVSTREGARLRRILAEKGSCRVKAEVEARFYHGSIENLSILIPGMISSAIPGAHPGPADDAGEEGLAEEILVVAHLCHPRPSANDNASGAAAGLEAARVLANAIASGRLGRPRRGIRFLLVPEMTGTYAFLAALGPVRRGNIRAALNLDMVGEDQAQCRSVLLSEHPPLAAGSWVGHLLERVVEATADDVQTLGGTCCYGLFARAATPFSGGSDHYILSDPMVGIPCPMLIQWPDRFYHTSADTPDRVDPRALARAAVIAATYAYFLAGLGEAEAEWLAAELAADFPARLRAFLGRQGGAALRRRAELLAAREVEKLRSLSAWVGKERQARFAAVVARAEEAVRGAVERELGWREASGEGLSADAGPEPAAGASDQASVASGPAAEPPAWQKDLALVPRRLQPGPTPLHLHLVRLAAAERDEWWQFARGRGDGHLMEAQLEYWADGRRTIGEIADLVELETGRRDDEFAVRFFRLLERLGRVEPAERAATSPSR